MTQTRSPARVVCSLLRRHSLALAFTLVILFGGGRLFAEPSGLIEPTEEQLQSAFAAASALGGEFHKRLHPQVRQAAHVLIMPRSTVDADLEKIPDFSFSFGLELFGTSVTDAGLKRLPNLRNLRGLYIHGTRITDAGLRELARFENLAILNLAGCKGVTDGGLKELANVKNLATLDLSTCTKVTDAGLKELAAVKNLSRLGLIATKVTDAGLKDLGKLKNLNS